MNRTAIARHSRRANPHGLPARQLLDRLAGVRPPHPSDGFVAALTAAYAERTDTARMPRIVLTAGSPA